jgi:hypothetical protein
MEQPIGSPRLVKLHAFRQQAIGSCSDFEESVQCGDCLAAVQPIGHDPRGRGSDPVNGCLSRVWP